MDFDDLEPLELLPEEPKDDATFTVTQVRLPPNVDILTGYEMMTRELNYRIYEHEVFKWELLYQMYYG